MPYCADKASRIYIFTDESHTQIYDQFTIPKYNSEIVEYFDS